MLFPYPQSVELKTGIRGGAVRRESAPELVRPDEYEIVMKEDETLIRSASASGFFYAEKTLKNLPADQIGRIHDWADVPLRIQMIDLKRIDWNFDYLLSLFPLFAEFKINACLIEYEDKFPYRFTDQIAVPAAFTREQLLELKRVAKENHVELIPLVQCFSHWEYILKHDAFAGIREDQVNVSQGCPLNPGTFELFRSMLGEILELHDDSRFVHIGGDEARLLGHCPECAEKVRREGVEKLYGDYLERAIDEVNAHGRTPLFWADFFWHHEAPLIRRNCIAVDWEYAPRAFRSDKTYIGIDTLEYGGTRNPRYAPYLKPSDADRTIFAFPHLLWLRDHGYCAFGAGYVNSSENILAHAVAAAEEKCPAVLATYWASFASLTPPTALYPWRICGIARLGAAAWNSHYEQENQKTFHRRLAEKMGEPAEMEIMYRQMDNQGTMIAPMRYRTAPVAAGGRYAFLGRKAQFDYQMQKLFGDRPLLPESAYEMLPLGSVKNSTLNFEIGNEECKFTIGRLNFMPQGRFICSGSPFLLEDGVAVYGSFPGQTTPAGIILEVKEKKHPDFISVIQSLVGSASENRTLGVCILHYRDGAETVPLVMHRNLGNWWTIENEGELQIAFSNIEYLDELPRTRLGLHCWNCVNPHPERELLRIEFKMTDSAVVALAAVTLQENAAGSIPEAVAELAAKSEELEQLAGEFRNEIAQYVGSGSIGELETMAFSSQRTYLESMKRFLS